MGRGVLSSRSGVCWALLVYCLLWRGRGGGRGGQSKGEVISRSLNTILFPSWSRYDGLLWPNKDSEGGVKSWLTPAARPSHHPRNTKDAPHESSAWGQGGFKKSNIQTVDPDSPWLLTKKLSINDDDEHWRLSYISLPILSVRTLRFIRNQSDRVANVETMMARQAYRWTFRYFDIERQRVRVQKYKSQYHNLASTIQVHINRQQGRLN